MQDLYLPTNALAALANLAPQVNEHDHSLSSMRSRMLAFAIVRDVPAALS
jgi:hypothetical protein